MYFNFSEDEAKKFIEKEDEKRRDYVKHYFHKDIDDPSLYDLVLNTERHSIEETAKILSEAIIIKLKRYFD